MPEADEVRQNGKPIIIRDGLLGKIAVGLFCASVVSLIMNFAGLRWLVVHLFALFLGLFGKGEYVVHPVEAARAEVKERLEAAEAEAKKRLEAAKQHFLDHAVEAARAAPLPAGGVIPPVVIGGFKSEAEREADRQRKEQKARNALLARADAVKLACDAGWTDEKLKLEVEQAEQQAREAPERKLLLARGDKLGLESDPACDLKTLREQVKEAEEEARLDADYQAAHRQWERDMEKFNHDKFYGPNARCPRCRYAMQINSSKHSVQCRKCLYIFGGGRGWAMWEAPSPPEEPQPPRKKPGLIRRVLGGAS